MLDRMKKLTLAFASATMLFAAAPVSTPASALPRGPVAENTVAVKAGFRRFRRLRRFRRHRRHGDFRRFRIGVLRDWRNLPKQCRKYWWLYQHTGRRDFYWLYRRCVSRWHRM